MRCTLLQVVQDPEECYTVVLVAWAGIGFATDELLMSVNPSEQVWLWRA